MIGLIIEGVLGFAFESARCKQLKEAYVGPVVDIVRFQGWASTHRLNSQLGLSQRDARFVLLVACQRGLIFQAVNGRYYLAPAQAEAMETIVVEPPPDFRGITEAPRAEGSANRRGWKAPLALVLSALGLVWIGGIAYTQMSIRQSRSDAPQPVANSSLPASVSPTLAHGTTGQTISEQLNAAPTPTSVQPTHQHHKHAHHHDG